MAADQSISLSFAVVCYEPDPQELQRLIASLCVAVDRLGEDYNPERTDLYLINNAENRSVGSVLGDETRPLLKRSNLRLHEIAGHGNIGYGRAQNLILGDLDSDFHLMMNADIELAPEALAEGLTYLLAHNDVVMVSPRATGADATRQYLCKRYPSVFTFIVRGFFPDSLKRRFEARLASFEMRDLPEDRPSMNIPICSGCFMLCRTDALQTVTGFDPRYFLYFEDFDLSLRLAAIGKLAYVPKMNIRHNGGHAARKGWKHIRMFLESGWRFFSTHGWRWVRQATDE